MKKIVNVFLLVASILVFQKDCFAQKKSELKIYDLNPGVETDSTVSKEGKSRLYVNFKLSDANLADSVFFRFGTEKGEGDVITEIGKFSKKGAVISVKTQGPEYNVINSEVSCKIKITKKQLVECRFVSLVVKDKTGLYTDVLTMRIN